jgi:H+-transporting ATPase
VVLVGTYVIHWSLATLQTVIFLDLVFSGQATLFLMRERGPVWSSRPSTTIMVASGIDVLIFSALASLGILMAPVSPFVVLALFALVVAVALVLDRLKLVLFRSSAILERAPPTAAPG